MRIGACGFLGVKALVVFFACSDDGGSGSPDEAMGAEAGASIDSESGRATGGSDSVDPARGGEPGQPDGGKAAQSDGGASPAEGGRPGAGGVGASGEAGASGPLAEAGAGGAITYPQGPYVLCPAVGEKFQVRQTYLHTDEEYALAKAFGCDVGGDELGDFTIERFEVEETIFEVLASPHRFDNYDRFTVIEDCGPFGYVEPIPYGEYTSLYAEVLQPGIYTRVSCGVDMYIFDEPVPPAPTNVDCAHAKPLPKAPAAALDETRVGDDQARFYNFTIPFDPQFPDEVHRVTINTGYSYEGAMGADVMLSGTDNDYDSDSFILWLDGEKEAIFEPVEPGSYCVEFKVRKGVKYSIYYSSSYVF